MPKEEEGRGGLGSSASEINCFHATGFCSLFRVHNLFLVCV